MARKTRKDSVTSQVQARSKHGEVIELPEGVTLRTDEERTLWRQFTSARDIESFREFDLILIHKLVKLEADIRKHNAMIDRTSVLIENKRGTMVPNPLLSVVDQLERRMLAVVRTLSLGTRSNDAVALNESGAKAKENRDLEKIKKGNVVSLLA